MEEKVSQLVAQVRFGAIAQAERKEAVIALGELLYSNELSASALTMRDISRGEADFVAFDRLQKEDGKMWFYLNQALIKNGYAPAITLREAMQGIGETSPQQVGEWFGTDAIDYIKEKIEQGADRAAIIGYLQVLRYIRDAVALALILDFLGHADAAIRTKAAEALSGQDPSASIRLVEQSKLESDPSVSRALANSLGAFNQPETQAALKSMLETHKDPFTRQEAGKSLIRLGNVDIVLDVMNSHADKMFQSSAAEALAGSDEPGAISALIQGLSHPYFMIQIAAITKLGSVASEDAFEKITEHLLNGSYSIRKSSAEAIVGYGDKAVPFLVQVFDHTDRPKWAQSDPTISEYAKLSLEKIGTPLAIDAAAKWRYPDYFSFR